MVNTKVKLCGIELDNPVMAASGTFGYGYEFAELWDINKLGSFSFKGTTKNSRFGNPTPRIAECPAGMINSVGLQNPGVEAVLNEELPKLEKVFHKPVIANVGGFSIEEYAYNASALDADPRVGWVEVNISCPNVHDGGIAFGTSPEAAASVTKAVKAVCKKPVIIKLSPNVTDICEIGRACEAEGADGLCLINTLLGMRIDVRRRKPVIANKMGGFSGDAIFPVAVRMVYQMYEAVKIPIIGVGGIHDVHSMLEIMMAGAVAVQVGAANLVDPYVCEKMADTLPAELEKLGIKDINEIIGVAHG